MLLDHFHSPLKDQRPWTGFHGLWAGKLASAISRRLPDEWFAAPTVHWDITNDVVEVQVFRDLGELVLVGAVELVSPANKDRPENREAFVAKCDALLRSEVGLVIVDIVTHRRGNLHADLLERWGEQADEQSDLYMAAYRPFKGESGPALSMWYRTLAIGAELPEMPLFLKNGPMIDLPFAETYRQTCADLKISAATTPGP